MKWEMEILQSSSPYISNPNWHTKWTPAENKLFENALAFYDKDTPDRWARVAAMIPGKTVGDVMKQYKELEEDVCNIEAGLVPIPPGYDGSSTNTSSQFTLDWVNTSGFDAFKPHGGKRSSSSSSSGRPPEQERKKGVPWTEEEHKLFLLGLKKYGKGDWRNISRNFVVTRTPTQVASHAQKYFIRQLSGGKDKRRASIHDITTVNLSETTSRTTTTTTTTSPSCPVLEDNNNNNNNRTCNSKQDTNSSAQGHFWNQANNNNNNARMAMGLNPNYGITTYAQNLHSSALHESSSSSSSYLLGPQTQNMVLQMQQPTQHFSHA
ncbi:transcription factor DIVARICATA-like [Senna tora]|uniref:Transcription factor DIVARICATA-like n=1 Tax=Senna tora TaxID=362788 RepID=A0A834WWT5_9FABA|nr:transcription factor DIVARICATA-like [Senna tora]